MHFSLSSSSSFLSLRLGSCVGSLCPISVVAFHARNSIATLQELQPGVGLEGGGGGRGKRGQILLAQNFATTPQTQNSIIILLSFLHRVIFSTPSDKSTLNVLPLLSTWETLFLSMSPFPASKQLQQQQCLIHYYSLERNSSSAPRTTSDAVKKAAIFLALI